MKACRHLPTFVKPGQSPRSRVIFAVEGFISYSWKKQQGEEGILSFALLEEALATQDVAQNKRRIRILDLVGHTMMLCGADAHPVRAPRGNLARELGKVIVSEKVKRE